LPGGASPEPGGLSPIPVSGSIPGGPIGPIGPMPGGKGGLDHGPPGPGNMPGGIPGGPMGKCGSKNGMPLKSPLPIPLKSPFPWAPGSCFRFSAKSTRILEQFKRSPDKRTARSTELVSAYSTWQNKVPLRLLQSSLTSLISPQRSKSPWIISSLASLGKPPTQTVLQSSGFVDSGTARSLPTRYACIGLSSAKSKRIGTPLIGVPAKSTALSTASVSKNFMCPNCPFRS